jgi:hypothetical protein
VLLLEDEQADEAEERDQRAAAGDSARAAETVEWRVVGQLREAGRRDDSVMVYSPLDSRKNGETANRRPSSTYPIALPSDMRAWLTDRGCKVLVPGPGHGGPQNATTR